MMRSFNGSSQYLYTAGMAAGNSLALPITMSCWFVPKNTSLSRIIMLYGAADQVLISAICNYPSASYISNQYYGNNALPATVNTVTSYNVHHIMLTVNSVYNTIYLNGVKGANASISSTPGNIDSLYIGAYPTPQEFFYGDICDVAIWRGYGTADMAQRLYCGANPLDVNPHDIIDYYPLGSNGIASDASAIKNKVLTAVGSPTWSNRSPRQQSPVTMKQRTFRAGIPPAPPVLANYPIFKSTIAYKRSIFQ